MVLLLATTLHGVGEVEPSAAISKNPWLIPAGTALQIRLRQTISSFGSKRQTPVSAIVIAPVEWNGVVVIPLNSELRGRIVDVRRVGIGLARESARLELKFDQLILPNGRAVALKGRVAGVDDSREKVDARGRILGIRATASFSSTLSGLAVSAAGMDPMLLMFGLSSSLSVFRIPESEIILPAGSELHLQIDEAFAATETFPTALVPLAIDENERETLAGAVRGLPFRTVTAETETPSDLTSMVLVANREALLRAFDAAGWVRADELNSRSRYGAMRAVIENQGYREAPMSTLLLEGKSPALSYAKTLDTFFKRHHTRIYESDAQFRGAPMWSATATHDSGIAFAKQTKTMIHLIDSNIDEEREKIVNDLLLTGCVQGVERVERPTVPRDATNATGDALITDGAALVLLLNNCDAPVRADEEDVSLPKVQTKGSTAVRILRDTDLVIRNDFYRGNTVYQGYSGVRMAVGAIRKKAGSAREPRTIQYGGEEFSVVEGTCKQKGTPKDPGSRRGALRLPGERPSLATLVDFTIGGGYATFGNDKFSTQQVTVTDQGNVDPITAVAELHTGYTIAPKATLHTWKYVSNEFGFTYNKAALSISAVSRINGPSYDRFDGQIRQFSYATLIHMRPNGSRFRPYVAVGPVFQLLRLSDSKPTVKSFLKFTIKDIGMIEGAYEFGSKPPLEGGGIFQVGLQYGGGFKTQLTPHLFFRADMRETLSPEPDYWTKSYPTLRSLNDSQFHVEIGPLTRYGPLRQQVFSAGFGVSF